MNHLRLRVVDIDNSRVDKLTALYFSLSFLLASFFASLIMGEWGTTFSSFLRILRCPSPLVTDYFRLGSLSAAFLNAGLCGLGCTILMVVLKAKCNYNTYAGFFLVTAHCFYGLNFLNMWPPILGILVYSLATKRHFRDELSTAFYATAFSPFFSELFFRYPLVSSSYVLFGISISLSSFIFTLALSLFIGFAVPAMLRGAKLLHRELSLYNGGLAFGLLGMLMYSFLYNILGVPSPSVIEGANPLYEAHGSSYFLFCNLFFFSVFVIAIVCGWLLNGGSFKGYSKLLKDPGFKTDFLEKYGDGVTMMNLGVYGLFMVMYFDLVILLTSGAGWTGATCGIVLASVTFSASGQHPKNVWPVLSGYVVLHISVILISKLTGHAVLWTLSTQAFMNGAAFATGLCPFTGRYGRRYGMAAGILSAILCTATLPMHGGLMLYNGGLVAGMAALILSPLLDHYGKKEEK